MSQLLSSFRRSKLIYGCRKTREAFFASMIAVDPEATSQGVAVAATKPTSRTAGLSRRGGRAMAGTALKRLMAEYKRECCRGCVAGFLAELEPTCLLGAFPFFPDGEPLLPSPFSEEELALGRLPVFVGGEEKVN